ncbi:Uncharacterised protein [Mycobacterium tuberculosis]|nr:Uncharacterised protein [Mycobacterium tuberculosis]
MTNPSETTSPRASPAISRIVGSMISLTTLVEKKLCAVEITRCSMMDNVSAPNSGAT